MSKMIKSPQREMFELSATWKEYYSRCFAIQQAIIFPDVSGFDTVGDIQVELYISADIIGIITSKYVIEIPKYNAIIIGNADVTIWRKGKETWVEPHAYRWSSNRAHKSGISDEMAHEIYDVFAFLIRQPEFSFL